MQRRNIPHGALSATAADYVSWIGMHVAESVPVVPTGPLARCQTCSSYSLCDSEEVGTGSHLDEGKQTETQQRVLPAAQVEGRKRADVKKRE